MPLINYDVAYSKAAIAGTGTTGPFTFNFDGGYMDQSYVKAFIYDPDSDTQTDVTLTFTGQWTVTTSAAVPIGKTLYIYRDTPKDSPLNTFTDGLRLTSESLNANYTQAINAIAELVDDVREVGQDAETATAAAIVAANNATAATEEATAATKAATSLVQNIQSEVDAAVTKANTASDTANAASEAANAISGKADSAAASATAAQTSAAAAANSSAAATAAVGTLTTNLASSGGSGLVGFIQSGSGAVARTLQDKERDIVDAEDFGAVYGGTTDCTTAINLALAAHSAVRISGAALVSSAGAALLFSAGLYGPGSIVYQGYTFPAGDIYNSLTLPVPAVFPTPQAALQYLASRRIRTSAKVTIKIANGTYAFSGLQPSHPDGANIDIEGDVSGSNAVIVNFDNSNTADFISVSFGVFGNVRGVTVRGTKGWTAANTWTDANKPYGCAAVARRGGAFSVGPYFYSDKMYYGLRANEGGYIAAVNPATVGVSNAGDVGYHAYGGGTLDVNGTTCSSVGDTAQTLGTGYLAEFGGVMNSAASTVSQCLLSGVGAISNGVNWSIGTSSSDNGIAGFFAANGGHCIGVSGTATGNRFGFRAQLGGSIEADASSAISNTGDAYSANCNGTIDIGTATATNNGGSYAAARNSSVITGTFTQSGNGVTSAIVDATSLVGVNTSL